MSLTISGWVGEQVMWWDDGEQRGTYVQGLGHTLASHVTFNGQATISPGWYAGYVLQIELDEHDSLLQGQGFLSGAFQDVSGISGLQGPNASVGINTFQSYWFVKSDKLGKVSVGLQSPAGDNAAILVDGSGSLVPDNWVMFDNALFEIRTPSTSGFGFGPGNTHTAIVWGQLGHCGLSAEAIGGDCVATTSNVVRYDSPVFAGFSLSADWGGGDGLLDNCSEASSGCGVFFEGTGLSHSALVGQHEYWDVYGRYAGEWNGIKLAATSGWSHQNSGSPGIQTGCFGTHDHGFLDGTQLQAEANSCEVGYWQSGIYIEHVATGLFVYGAYGREFWHDPGAALFNSAGGTVRTSSELFNYQPDHWMVKGGVRERWSSLGHTVLYGSYAERNDMFDESQIGDADLDGGDAVITSTQIREWSLGVVQEIDAAAMSMWVQYNHFDASIKGCDVNSGTGLCFGGSGFSIPTESFQQVKFGALINF